MNIKGIERLYNDWLNWSFHAKIISALMNVTLWSIATLVAVNYVVDVNRTTEQTGNQLILLGQQTVRRAGEKVNEEVKLLQTLAKTPSIVDAVMKANDSRADWSPQFITFQDEAWTTENSSIKTTVQEIAGNPISTYLLDFQKHNPEEVEIFVSDVQGLNIAMTNRTSDFLQADEDWWRLTFANGNGSVYFGPVEYDESSRTYAMKLGVPILGPETNRAIGVLRGTLDISVLMHNLENVNVGKTGNVVLIDSAGTILYSHNSGHLMKPAPTALLKAFDSRKVAWEQTMDLDGNPSIVAHSFLDGFLGQSLGWRLLITQHQAEIDQGVVRSQLFSLLASGLVAVFGILISATVLSRSIARPLTMLTNTAQELSLGNILRDESDGARERLHLRKDEIGAISRAFDKLVNYFDGAANASSAIANKDLTITVTPNSDRDELGIAFARMLEGLQQVIYQVAENAQAVSSAASQLAAASVQSGRATNQVAFTIQQMALGTSQQSHEVSKTSGSVEQMNRAIQEVARGAQEQGQAVAKASTMAVRISSTIQQVAANVQSGVRGVSEAADAALSGARTIEATITGMQAIKAKVGLSAQKVREMGQRSEQIDTIVETINEIASQTNLLALNAAIEAARVESLGEKTVESILQRHLLGATNLVAELLAAGRELKSQDLQALARQSQVEQFSISDSDGIIVAASSPESLGFRFSDDPRHQSSVFRSLLSQRDGVVVQPIRARDQDGKPYVFVGVSRRDCPGIVQAGISGEVVYRLGGYSRGFAVVADEIRKLADHAKCATKEISTNIQAIQKVVLEAGNVMEAGLQDVEHRSAQATEAGTSLATILQTVDAVIRQIEEIAIAVQHMDESSKELVRSIEAVSSVVKENIAATEEMAANSSEMARSMESIASISEENSAAVEEVGASAEEISAQVEEVGTAAQSLAEMAQTLQELVGEFTVNETLTQTMLQV